MKQLTPEFEETVASVTAAATNAQRDKAAILTKGGKGRLSVTPTQAVTIIAALLECSGWDTDSLRIRAALPHAQQEYDGLDLLATIQALHVPVTIEEGASLRTKSDAALVLIISQDASFRLAGTYFDSNRFDTRAKKGELRLSVDAADFATLETSQENVGSLLATFKGYIGPLLLSSFAINIVGLLTPIFVMLVYNRAIPAGDVYVIAALGMGLALAFSTEIIIRVIRNRIMLELSTGAEHFLSQALLKQLMVFPHDLLLGSSIEQQRGRLKQFEGLRDAIVGPLVQVALDLPFVIIFGLLLFFVAPPVAIVVTCAALAQLAFTFVFTPFVRNREKHAAESARTMRQICETVVNERLYMRRSQGSGPWRKSFLDATGDALSAITRLQFSVELSAHISQLIIMVAGVSGGLLATHMVIEGSLSVGGFVAILVVIWRFLAPVQSITSAAGQISILRQTVSDINAVLALPGEKYRGVGPRADGAINVPVIIEQASFRFPRSTDFAITGASLRLSPGKITAVSGPNLAGKTVLVEAVAGLHSLASGRIMFAGKDLRQVPVDDLRRHVAFAAQHPTFLYGTIFQNFALSQPDISSEQVLLALEEIGIRAEVERLPEGIHTRFNNENMRDLPHELKQGISLTRALLHPGPVRIFDQPTEGLDPEIAKAVRLAIRKRKRNSATLLVSNTIADLALADNFITLQHGRIVQSGQGKRGFEKACALLENYPGPTP